MHEFIIQIEGTRKMRTTTKPAAAFVQLMEILLENFCLVEEIVECQL